MKNTFSGTYNNNLPPITDDIKMITPVFSLSMTKTSTYTLFVECSKTSFVDLLSLSLPTNYGLPLLTQQVKKMFVDKHNCFNIKNVFH